MKPYPLLPLLSLSLLYAQQNLVLNSDTDTLTNPEERQAGTDPLMWDTDGDRVPDDVEVRLKLNPLGWEDLDQDGLPDDWQAWIRKAMGEGAGTGPEADPDQDGIPNLREFELGTSPVTPRQIILVYLTEDQGYHGSLFGTKGLKTPGMDQLGREGVVFDRAFSLASVCSPSKMAFYTGTYPHMSGAPLNVVNYGVNFPLQGDPSVLNRGGVHEDLPTLIEILNDRGWFTAVTHKSHVQPVRKFPFRKGYPNGAVHSPEMARRTIRDAVQSAGDRPLFLLFGIPSPHLPFKGIPQVNGKWSDTGGLAHDGHVTNVDPGLIEVPNMYPDVPAVRQDIADYYGAIQVVDEIFQAVASELEAMNLREKTLLAFTSDHGIGLHRAKQSIYGAGLHVPLIIRGPGFSSGRRIAEPVTHLDLLMTLIEFAGLPSFSHHLGKSLLPILRGDQDDFSDRNTIMTTVNAKYDARGTTDGKYYYIRNLRQVEGSRLRLPVLHPNSPIDPVLDKALNTDQYRPGRPWFNRTFVATVEQEGSLQRELLRQLVEGDLPDEELYDMEEDLWMVRNLAKDPAYRSVKNRLSAELDAWRLKTRDLSDDSRTLTRRSERIPGMPIKSSPALTQQPPPKTEPSPWQTVVKGNQGAEFKPQTGFVSSPAGPRAIAIRRDLTLAPNTSWQAEIQTGFFGPGVMAGLVVGYAGPDNYLYFAIQDLRGPDQGPWVARLVERSNGKESVLWEETRSGSSDANALFKDNMFYRLHLNQDLSGGKLTFSVTAQDMDEPLLSGHIPSPTLKGTQLGILTGFSQSARFRGIRAPRR